MENKEFDDIEIYRKAVRIERIGNIGVKKAIEENKSKGIPSVYSINGRIVYELPNGEITEKEPDIFKD